MDPIKGTTILSIILTCMISDTLALSSEQQAKLDVDQNSTSIGIHYIANDPPKQYTGVHKE